MWRSSFRNARLQLVLLTLFAASCRTPAPVNPQVRLEAPPTGTNATYPIGTSPTPVETMSPVPAITQPLLPSVKLSAPLGPGESAANFRLTPDSRNAVYLADGGEYERAPRFYSVPLEDGPALHITRALTTSGFVQQYEISPDSRMLVWSQSPPGNVFAVPLAGGEVLRLNQGVRHPYLPSHAHSFHISPDSSTVLFHVKEQDGFTTNGLYSVPITGGNATRITDAQLDPSLVAISPDSSTVVYAQSTGDRAIDLYAAPIKGGPLVRLREGVVLPMTAFGIDYTMPLPFQISPDGSTVVYGDRQPDSQLYGLHSVSIGGGDSQQLADPDSTDESLFDFQISRASAYVVYRTGAENAILYNVPQHSARLGIRSVPLRGGAVVALNPSLPPGGEVDYVEISPDSQHVLYTAEQDTDEVVELYRVPIVGGDVRKLSGPRHVSSKTLHFRISAQSDRVVYAADLEHADMMEVYGVSLTGGPTVKLSGPVPPGNRSSAKISPDGRFVVFSAYRTDFTQAGLYLRLLETNQMRTVFENPPNTPRATDYEISADGRYVVYSANGEVADRTELYRAEVP